MGASLALGPLLRAMVRQKGPSSLVVMELATGFLTISCLLLASGWYYSLTTRPRGYDDRDVVLVTIERPAAAPDAEAAARAAARADVEVTARLGEVREVAAFTAVSSHLLDQRWNYPVELSGWSRSSSPGPPARAVGWTIYTGAAIAGVLGLRVLEGALPRGEPGAVTVITRCLRDRLFPGGLPAVGGVVRADDATPAVVAAVVEDVALRDPWNAQASCVALRFDGVPDDREARYLVRAHPGQRPAALAALRARLGETTPDRRVAIEPFDPSRSHYFRMARGLGGTLALSGGLIVLCALLGTFTVSTYLVGERTRSIGIRRALGARPSDIVRAFVVETSILTLLGVAAGLLLTAGVFGVMRTLYPGLRLGLAPLALTAFVLWLGAVLGALLPARRAAAIPPSMATRG